MEITYLGHSSFKIKGKTASVVTDPFDPKMVGLKYSGVSADIVTISHQHEDHNMVELVKDVRKVIDGPGEYEVSEISIIGFPAFHDNEKGEKRGSNIIYIFEVNNVVIAHLGDLGHTLPDKIVEEIGDIDVLMIPVGGEYTISPTQAVACVQAIEPKIIIPMHYKLAGMNEEVFGKLHPIDDFLKEMGLPVENLPKLSVKKSEMEENQKVVVLETR